MHSNELTSNARPLHDSADGGNADFLAAFGHALRNPLTPLSAGVAIIRRCRDPETIAEQCALMARQLEQLNRLADDLLDASRFERGVLAVQKSRIELGTVARTAAEQNRELFAEAGHSFAVLLPAKRLWVDADPVRLGQVLNQLLRNAARHTPRGGRVELEAGPQGAGLCVAVRDTGVGIAGDDVDAIFEAFGQLDRSLETGFQGLGFGLALVKRLVELHGGTVSVRSAGPGKGSEFSVWLPAAAEAAAPAPVAPRPRSQTKARRVLLVDDNRDVARSLSRLVAILGHDVRVAHDGMEALRLAEEYQPEVVLMDIGLPSLNGYDAARALRSKHGRALTLIAVTGWGSELDRLRAHDAGFDRHLTKPVEAEVLESVLNG